MRRAWPVLAFAGVLAAPLVPVYEVSSLPVLDRDHAAETARALMRYLLASRDLPHVLRLPLLPLDGPCHAMLAEACRQTGSAISFYERWIRPVMTWGPKSIDSQKANRSGWAAK